MIKKLPEPIFSEEVQFNNQLYQWLNDSHYWIQEGTTTNVNYVCKWCGTIMPMALHNSTICIKNPEVFKIINKKCNDLMRQTVIDFCNKFNEECGFPVDSNGIEEYVDNFLMLN